MNALKRINDALPGLVAGVVVYGVLCEAISIWFVADKIKWSVGMFGGVVCAVGMAIHIAIVIDDSVRTGASVKVLAAKSLLRYAVVAAVFFAMAISQVGDVIAAFIGVMGLKISAYAQPYAANFFQHKDNQR